MKLMPRWWPGFGQFVHGRKKVASVSSFGTPPGSVMNGGVAPRAKTCMAYRSRVDSLGIWVARSGVARGSMIS